MVTLSTRSPTRSLSARQKLMREVRLSMGEGMIKVALTPDHYEMAFDMALDRYRVRSSNAVEERVGVLELLPDQNEYFLPDEIILVRQVFRRGIIGGYNGTSGFDPFGAAFANQFNFSSFGVSGGMSDLVSYELANEYQALLGRLVASSMMFQWSEASHKLSLQRNIRGPETVLLWMYLFRPEELLLRDDNARLWLRDYTIAKCKLFEGEAREKFGSFPSPQGGMTLNGSTLKAEAVAEMERLENEVKNQVDQSIGMPFLFG